MILTFVTSFMMRFTTAVLLTCICAMVCFGSLEEYKEHNDCNQQECPDYKPFCTPIGCVVECPTNAYINGTTCLVSCSEWYIVEDRVCQFDCPSDHFIKTKTILTGDNYKLERHCVKFCDSDWFVFNRTCYPKCPPEAQYIDGVNCLEKCPKDKTILSKLSPQDEYLKCEYFCDSNVFENGICVGACSAGKFLFNTTCVSYCPSEANILSFEGGNNVCKAQCDNGRVDQNGTCVEFCSENEYVYNGSCVPQCPQDSPFMEEDTTSTYCATCKVKWLKNTFCLVRCSDEMLQYQNKCVLQCPNDMFVVNSSCIKACPEVQPVRVVKEKAYFFGTRSYSTCEPMCREVNKCVCPIAKPYLHNGTCHNTCPLSHNMTRKSKYSFACVKNCETYEFIHDGHCVQSCPDNVPFVYNRQCLQQCPGLFTYVPLHSMYTECLDDCPSHDLNIFNKTCVSTCPSDQKYLNNFTCTNICRTRYVDKSSNLCLEECRDGTYVLNDTSCVTICPSTHNYIHNKTCSKTDCFTEFRFTHKKSTNVECVNKCPTDTYITDTNVCTKECLHFGSKCVDTCPMEAPYVDPIHNGGAECRHSCSQNILNNTCVNACPQSMSYRYGNECLDHCPSTARAMETDYSNIKHCVEKCMDNYVILNKSCIYESDCKRPNVVFGDECLTECPEGNFWLDGGIGCVQRNIIYILIAVLFGFEGVVLFLDRRNIIDFFVYTKYAVIKCQEGPFEFDIPNKDREDERLINKGDREPLLEVEEIRTETNNLQQVAEYNSADTIV